MALDPLVGPVRSWFHESFPLGPTPAQRLAWPVIDRREHLLLISPTGTGKTLAAFLAILNRFQSERDAGKSIEGLRCVYVSPLRSLGRDIERNLTVPIEGIRAQAGLTQPPFRVAVRTGDTPAHQRRKVRENPPQILITTPESLSLMLSQSTWREVWKTVQYVIIDEVHALVSKKRGTDLAITLERLAALSNVDPCRIGLSATCRPADRVARFLVGSTRTCTVIEAEPPERALPTEIVVESLVRADEQPYRRLTGRRLIRRLGEHLATPNTTLVFANTRALTERLTHDLRAAFPDSADLIAAHHGSLEVGRRQAVESALKAGELRLVVTSTSLELGVDIGRVELAIVVGQTHSTARCLQRIGRAGHSPDAATRGVLIAQTPAELFSAAVTARAARECRIEPVKMVENPLDVLCQQLIAMACLGECSCENVYELIRKAGPMSNLSRQDFDACVDSLAGDLAAPPGAFEPEPGATPKWTSPRIWRSKGLFGVRNWRVVRWFWGNVGTIVSEETITVVADGVPVGRLEADYADSLQRGDRIVLDGRALVCKRNDGRIIHATATGGDPLLPIWRSDLRGLSAELARDVAAFRHKAALLLEEGAFALRNWLDEEYAIDAKASALVEGVIHAQQRRSLVPCPQTLLIEEYPDPNTGSTVLAFHVPLGRPACEALARATSARLGKHFGRNLELRIADLGWSIQFPEPTEVPLELLRGLFDTANFEADILEGVDRGELMALRFRHVAATALMVLRNAEGKRVRVGGLLWVSRRLYPLVQAACPSHPLLKETRREVLEELLDAPDALAWLETRPTIVFRRLDCPSPFSSCWIDGIEPESLAFETQSDALARLHARLVGVSEGGLA